MHTTTPKEITRSIARLVERVSPGQTPIYLGVRLEPAAIINECFANVDAKIARDGGGSVHGWRIWEWPHVLVEAEFHAVWQSPGGELVEISPPPDRETTVLFVPDLRRRYQGVAIDNVRVPLRDEALIHDFIAVSAEIVKVMNRGDREGAYGYISVPAQEIEPLLELKSLTGYMLSQGAKSHDNCACGSGRKYKRCHGKMFGK